MKKKFLIGVLSTAVLLPMVLASCGGNGSSSGSSTTSTITPTGDPTWEKATISKQYKDVTSFEGAGELPQVSYAVVFVPSSLVNL